MEGLEVDEYISKFEALLGETTWTHIEPGTLALFTGGLPAWLVRRALGRNYRPYDLDSWQDAVKQEVAREIELQVDEARRRRQSPEKFQRPSSSGESLTHLREKEGGKIRGATVAYARGAKALNAMITFKTMLHETETRALIDSGATENFISPMLVQSLGLKPRALAKPIDIHTVDGSGHKDGKLTEFLWLTVQLGGKRTLLLFLVAAIGGDHLILGYPFLHRFNPRIDWRRTRLLDGRIHITSSRQTSVAQKVLKAQRAAITQCGYPGDGEALYVRSTQSIAQQFTKGGKLGEIPKEYQRHWKVFSEEESHRFLPQRSEDMKIQLKPGAPESIDCKVYPLSKEDRTRLQKWLEDKQKLERIALEESQYIAPVYFREKKLEDGTPSKEKRIIMDYRKINDHTVKDHNPLPNIQEAIERLHGKTLFSKFDIRWGYNNIQIAEEDQHKAAFKTPFGTYVPKVMYFGLSNAPPFFQRTMNRDFMGLLQQYPDDLGNYMDDWWIATTDDEEGRKKHREITHAFLDRMEKCSYFLKPSKCQFKTNSIKILGWIVGRGGVHIDPAKIKGLADWPWDLTNVKQVRQVLGVKVLADLNYCYRVASRL